MTINVFVDETFDLKNNYFYLVCTLIHEFNDDIRCLSEHLLSIEKKSKKRKIKWNGCSHERRKSYIEMICNSDYLEEKIFYGFNYGITLNEEIEFISDIIHNSIQIFSAKYNISGSIRVYFDEISNLKRSALSKRLRAKGLKKIKVRRVKKDENNEFIRLVDSICGLARDKIEDQTGEVWASKTMNILTAKKILFEI
ncbi:MAG: hypothetical protein NTW80_12580 [Deltaproteobacteria bacterium]|nr:hypothetical protein [Deltaproteobacteria bacterium]